MPDEYAKVAKGKLKLKTDGEISKKKKKKKDKEREKERDKVAYTDSSTVQIGEPSNYERKLTKAEQSFKKMQDKMVTI
jgi:protein FAM32A